MGEWVRSLGTSSTQSPKLDKELNHLCYHCSGNTHTQHMPERQTTENMTSVLAETECLPCKHNAEVLEKFLSWNKTGARHCCSLNYKKKAEHTNTHAYIPTLQSLPALFLSHLYVIYIIHVWWLCFSAGSCFNSACTALFNFFAAAANSLTAGGQTKAWPLPICAAAAKKHHSTEGRRATTLNRTWRVYAQKESVHHMCTSPLHLTAADVHLKTTRQVHSIGHFLQSGVTSTMWQLLKIKIMKLMMTFDIQEFISTKNTTYCTETHLEWMACSA